MTHNDLMQKMLDAFPHAELGEDHDGQLVIYTNLTLVAEAGKSPGDWLVVDMDDE